MSTRSVLAIPNGDGFKGRYCHSDGYPSGQLPVLRALVARDGVDAVIKTLVTGNNYGWSSLDAAPAHDLGPWRSDGRFKDVPGYGVAYTDDPTVQGGPQATEDQWITNPGDDWGTEWAYVLSERGIAVYRPAGEDSWAFTGFARWDGSGDEQELERD